MKIFDIQASILNSMDSFVVACDSQLNTVYVNPHAYMVSGYTPEEIGVGLTPELVHDEKTARDVRDLMQTALREGFVRGEAELVTKDGERLVMQQQFFAITDAEGNRQGVGVIMRDITQLRLGQRDLLTKSAIIESSDDFIVATDRDMNCIYANPGVYNMSGYTPEEIGLDVGPNRMHDAPTAHKILTACFDVIKNGVAWQDESELITADGDVRYIQQKLFPLKDEQGRITGTGTIIRDLTGMKSARYDADKRLEVLKNILDRIDAFVYVSDMETHEVLFINRRMKETFHIDDDDVAGRPCWSVIQQGMTERCSFCPLYKLEEDPETPVVWEETNTVTGQRYQNVDSVIEWTNGKRVHMQYAIDVTDIRKMQQEADNMLGVLKNILNGMDACVYVSDMSTDEILFINKRMQEMFGLDEDAVGKTCWKVLQKGFSERCSFCPNIRLEESPGTSVVWEEKNTVTGRSYKNVDSVIEWLDGKKVHMQHSTDITDILDVQKEVWEARERLEMALLASHAGVWEMNLQKNQFTYDKWCGRLLGLQPESGTIDINTLVTHFESIMAEESSPEMFRSLREKDLYADWPMRDSKLVFPDKSVRYVRSYGNAIRDEEGRTVRVIGMNMDITQNVNLENELKEAKIAAENKGKADADARTQIMLDATPLAASFWDADGNMLDCNMEAVRLFGLSEKSDYIDHFYELNPEYQPDGELTSDKSAKEIAEAFRTGYRCFEWMYKTKSGEDLPVETTLVRVPWKDEYRLAAYSRDLREIRAIERTRHEAEQRSLEMEVQARSAIAASEAKSQFLSNMSHEIRTPMNAITGMAELLSSEELNDRQSAYVNDIRESATSLLGIINDILDFSKIEAGKLQLVRVDYDLKQLLHNIESMFMFSAEKKGISFTMNTLGALPDCLYGDDIRLRQVLVNILGNAIKFTKEGGVIFTVRAVGDMLHFDIADTGVGIKKEDLPKVFEEFDQLDVRANRNIRGTGLGLSITKNLVSLMDGTIRVESEYGKGSTFYLEIPMVAGNVKNLSARQKEWTPISAPGAEILVVDDNEINLNVAVGLLRLSGITCDTALSGPDAIAKVADKQYDIVFMDHMMPEMDGVETTKILRQSYGKDELVIVALTANAVEGTQEIMLEAEMNDYLSKPIDKGALNRVLEKWLPADKIKKAPNVAHAQKAQGKLSPVLERVQMVAGINLPLALGRLGGMQEVYEKTLRIFIGRLPEAMGRLESFLREDDLKGFSIEVHGMKGSLGSIGATELAKKAEALEMRSKEGDGAFCMEHLPGLLSGLAKLQGLLAMAIGEENKDRPLKRGDAKTLMQDLATARKMLESFEADEAVEKLKQLACFEYGDQTNDVLQEIIRMIEEFNYERAMELIDQLSAEDMS